jgi:hypothetical protein
MGLTTWLRLLAVALTVGGGVCGIAALTQAIASSTANPLAAWVGVVVYIFITAAGLAYVHNERRLAPILAAIAVQIPWVSSPILFYQLSAGSGVDVGISGRNFVYQITWLGSSVEIRFFQSANWGGGLNLLALVVFILLWRSRRSAQEMPTKDSANNPATAASA